MVQEREVFLTVLLAVLTGALGAVVGSYVKILAERLSEFINRRPAPRDYTRQLYSGSDFTEEGEAHLVKGAH